MWKLPQTTRQVYARNPLQVVAAQLKFHPILKVGERLPDFQEKVRISTRFRDYRALEVQSVDVPFPTPMEPSARVSRQTQHQFLADDGTATLSLSQTSVGLNYRRHQSRERLLNETASAVTALDGVYAPVFATRFGLRYVNIIDRELISQNLGREVEWTELISPAFFAAPEDLVDLQQAWFFTQISSPIANGRLTVRYGLSPNDAGQTVFQLDMDRFVEDPKLAVAEVPELVDRFADDILSVFESACGPALRDWMNS